jgi:Calx-beta domain/Beta-propeller repeat
MVSPYGGFGLFHPARSVAVALLCLLAVIGIPAAGALAAPGAKLGAGPLPLGFEPNRGQAEAPVKFLARGRDYGLFLTATEAVLVLAPAQAGRPGPRRSTLAVSEAGPPAVVRMRWLGVDPQAAVTGEAPLPGRSHYFLGARGHWRRDVPTFGRVRYADVYPGISLVFYGSERQLEWDFVVAPGADPGAIGFAIEGTDALRVDGGDLVLSTSAGEVRVRRPVIYQEVGGARRPVEGRYLVEGRRVRFHVAAWDPARPLVIDPVLGYSTYLGGVSNDQGFGIAVDSTGSAYVTGSTISSDFPISASPVQPTKAGVTDAFVAKLDPSGTTLVYSTFLGGSGDDVGNAIAVDADGNAYVTGTTTSSNFPVLNPFQARSRGGNETFVTKLAPDGSALVYSTYLGSNGDDFAFGIALDAAANAYVTGSTNARSFPNANAVVCQGTKRTGDDAFVARVDATGTTLGYCAFIGGAGTDVGNAIAADELGNVWVGGSTTSSDLPVVNPIQAARGGRTDGFVGRLDPSGALVYLTYLGGSGDDEVLAITTDANGNAYVAGSTSSADFPTVRPLQPQLGGGTDAFVAKLNAAGSALTFSTFLGGARNDFANGVGVHPTDFTVYVAGSTNSLDFPVAAAPIQPQLAGGFDAFVAKLNAAGTAFVYSTYLGGASDDMAFALAVNRDGLAYLTGSTRSAAFPTVTPVQGPAGLLDAFVTQIADANTIQFTDTDYPVLETAGRALISVRRVGDTSTTATVEFATSDGTATAGSDYGTFGSATPPSGTLTFLPGQALAAFTVPILNPSPLCEGDETVNLTLTNPSFGSVLGGRSTATLTIRDTESCFNFSAPAVSFAENRGVAPITVTRSGPLTGPATVQFSTTGITAVPGTDYVEVTNRTLIFAAGVRSVTTPVTLINNTLADGTRTVSLALSNPTGGIPPVLLGPVSTATLDIIDDDVAGTIQFSQALYTVNETATAAVITIVRRGGTASGVTVDFATSDGPAPARAVAGVDYSTTSATVTFAAGQTVRTVSVPLPGNDATKEGSKLVTLTLTGAGGGGAVGPRSTAVLKLVDDEASVQFATGAYSVTEGAAASITVERTGTTGTVIVGFATSDGSATAGVDYTNRSGSLTFRPGVKLLTFSVPTTANTLDDGDRTLNLTLGPVSGTAGAILGPQSTATLTIRDNDAGGVVRFSVSEFTVRESAASVALTVVRSGGTAGPVTVTYATADGTALAGVDYTTASGVLTFAAGQVSRSIVVRLLPNTLDDGNRTFTVDLSAPTGGATLGAPSTATVTLVDDDVAGTVQFGQTLYTVNETATAAVITIMRSGGAASGATVDFATSDGPAPTGATAGVDYTTTITTLTFAAGQTSRTVTVPLAGDDATQEGSKFVSLTLSSPRGGATLGPRSTATLKIADDEATVQFAVASYSVAEGAAAVITVERTGTAGTVIVGYATADGSGTAGVDYRPRNGALTFRPGVRLLSFSVPTITNTLDEDDRTVNLTLGPVSGTAGAILGPQSTAVLRIVDNDAGGSLQFSTATFNAIECAVTRCNAVLMVTRTRGAAAGVTVDFATADGTAVDGTDYTRTTGTLTFAAGQTTQTIRVPLLVEPGPEPVKTFSVALTNPRGGATIGPLNSATVQITDTR